MKAPSAIKLVAAILLATAAAGLNTQVAFAQDRFVTGRIVTEDPQPTPTSTELSEADKQAFEKAREAAKQAKEKAREAAKQTQENNHGNGNGNGNGDGKGDSKFASGQLQLPPLVIRPATPNDKVAEDGKAKGNVLQNSSGTQTVATPAASADPNAITTGAGTGTKRFYVAPKTSANGGSNISTNQTGSQNGQIAAQQAAANSSSGQVTYVVSPLDDPARKDNSQDAKFVKLADPTANEPIRIVAAASLKTPADQFFEMAGYGILVLALGAVSLVGLGVYRGIKLRRSEVFDFEYRS